MNTNERGSLSEGIILAEALRCGFTVSVPWGNKARYDLILEIEGELIKIQCKTGKLVNDSIRVKLTSSYLTSSGSVMHGYTKQDVDYFAIYCPQNNKKYLLPISEVVGQKSINLRISQTNRNYMSGTKYADDYIFGKMAERIIALAC